MQRFSAPLIVFLSFASVSSAAPPLVFERSNLVAWCIVPFDVKHRTPEQRVEMLQRLGFTKYAYDWRAEHLPTFERELLELRKRRIELTAVWFPAALNADAQTILAALKKHQIKTQLWVTMSGGGPAKNEEEQRRRVVEHANAVRPIAEAAAAIGCSVALYNHGNWFGEPENQLAIIDALNLPNVGIVYNLHHGHAHLDRFPALLKRIQPHLYALNLNGMVKDGEAKGRKILPVGQGDLDLGLLQTIAASGYRGPVGILGHTDDDAEARLKDNLDGLEWLVPQLDGKPPGPKPKPRTPVAGVAVTSPTSGWIAEGRPEYRAPPLTIEVRARLRTKSGYNILVASDTKASAAHWELFTTPGDGFLTAYLPGRSPDHVRTTVSIADGNWHTAAMHFGGDRVQLYVDRKLAADQLVRVMNQGVAPGGIAFGRLVEGGIGCDGELAWARLARGVVPLSNDQPRTADKSTIGLWTFSKSDQPAVDQSVFKNTAKPAGPAASPVAFTPSPGPHLTPNMPGLRAVLIDRSQNDAYMGVKIDGAGRLFVGGREAVFVFEPDGRGGYHPRRELLRLPPDSIVIGLEYRGDDLYVQTVNSLYLVPGGRVKRDGLVLKRLLWGLPQDLHVSFHCLAWGPQGDLYLDHGDPLLNYGDWSRPDHWGHWTLFSQPEGTKVPYTGAGAVLRMRPDGTNLKVVARGLRGPVGLAFNRDWELFTNDNDHESRADLYAPTRLLHVVPHADFAWPRGWMASKNPDRLDLLEPVNSNMGRGVPCDQFIYDEPMIPELRDNLLLCRWDRMAVTRFPLRRDGATYKAEELPFLAGDSQSRPTGIAADRSGRLFVTAHYLSGNVVSPHCVSDLVMITRERVPPDPLEEETKASSERLMGVLASDSGEARRRAHNELLRRGPVEINNAMGKEWKFSLDGPRDIHTVWLWAAAFGEKTADGLATMYAYSIRPEVRLQVIRAIAEFPPSPQLLRHFQNARADSSPEVRRAALTWFMDAEVPPPLKEAIAAAQENELYLRQAGLTLLARRAKLSDLEQLVESTDAAKRLVGVAAVGIRLTTPLPNESPPSSLPLSYPKGNAFFHRELHFADGSRPVDLADLGPVGSYTTAERWKAIPPDSEQRRLFDLLVKGLDDPDDRVSSQSGFYLGLLRDPRSEPLVERATMVRKARGLAVLSPLRISSAWMLGPFAPADGRRPIETGPVDPAAEYPAAGRTIKWTKATARDGALEHGPALDGVTYAYVRIQSRVRQTALVSRFGSNFALFSDEERSTAERTSTVQLWQNGRPVRMDPKLPILLDLQPGGNDLLVRIHGRGRLALDLRAKERVAFELPERADAGLLAERLRSASGAAKIGPEFFAVDWTKEARGGDAERGRKLFGSLGCVKCHAITPDQTGGGAPSLVDAGKRLTPPALVESILIPDRQVADDYRATRLVLADGRSLIGLVVKETAGELELLLPDASRSSIKLAEIESRSLTPNSPMPAALIRTPAELQDLLAYLLLDHPTPP